MVQNSFQRAKVNLGNRQSSIEAKGQGCSIMKMRMVKIAFQIAKGNPGNRPYSMEAKKQRSHLTKYFFLYIK